MIQSVSIREHDEPYAPPSKILRLSVVADTVFASIDTYDETSTTETSTVQASVAVDWQTLVDALWVLRRADARPSRA